MSRYLLGQVLAFRGEDIYHEDDGAQIEVTEIDGDVIEIATNVGRVRIYIKVSLPELIRQAMRKDGDRG